MAPHAPRDTKDIFIDGQILLMQSRIDSGWTTWRDLALGVFGRRVCSAHRIFDHVVLAFDNYRCTPVFKSIEQAKRIKHASTFPFQVLSFKTEHSCLCPFAGEEATKPHASTSGFGIQSKLETENTENGAK